MSETNGDNVTPDPNDAGTGQPTTPPWGDDFSAERAWKLIENLRGDNAKLKERTANFEAEAQRRADAEKSELQLATERAARAEQALKDRDAADKRRDVLRKHGLKDEDAVFLAGVADDQLEDMAKSLAERFAPKDPDPNPAPDLSGKPAPRLTPGHETPTAGGREMTPDEIADAILRR